MLSAGAAPYRCKQLLAKSLPPAQPIGLPLGTKLLHTPCLQQFTYGVVRKGFFCGESCGNSLEILRKLAKIHFIASGKGAETLRKVC